MRASILIWSTLSGAVLGVFLDATLVGATLILGALLPGDVISARVHSRWIMIAAVILLTTIPLVLSVLGYLEGELKAV